MWNDLPDAMTTHWGAGGNADGASGKAFAVFGVPIILLILHLLCVFLTFLDKRQTEQNPKALKIAFFIFPAVSVFANVFMYCSALGKELDINFMSIIFGIMFICIGNYMPKIKQNQTLGIRVPWTLNNEENWNKTHRLGGKIWVIGGLIMLFSAVFPFKYAGRIMVFTLIIISVIPITYSYYIYKNQKKEGVSYAAPSKSRKIIAIISVILLFILLFTGNIDIRLNDSSFKINASYWTDLEINYSEIDSIEYRTDFDVGTRTNGFGSARLLMGIFRNDEFGSYTLYAYTGSKEFIVLKSEAKTLVIGMKNAENTREIYDAILSKIS